MGSFRHNPSNYIILDENVTIPLSFFVTLEPAYALPSGAITQEYIQGVRRKSSTGSSETSYPIPWTAGDGYISNKATYAAAYAAFLNPAPTLSQAKISKQAEVDSYNVLTIRQGDILYSDIEYRSDETFYNKIVGEFNRFYRLSAVPANYYVMDITLAHHGLNLSELGGLADGVGDMLLFGDQNADFHKAAIEALSTVNDVQNYGFYTGWTPIPFNPDLTFYAPYYTNIDADWALGDKTGLAGGGAAVVSSWLDLAHGDARYVEYDATDNANSQQVGAFRFTLKPNYTGTPSELYVFFGVSKSTIADNNIINLYHDTGGKLRCSIYDSSDTPILSGVDLGAWSPVSGTSYEIELNYDITAGATRLFIDGFQQGTTQTATGTRDSAIGKLHVGKCPPFASNSNFSINNFKCFKAVQHISNYTP